MSLLLTHAVMILSQRTWGLGGRSPKVPFSDGSSHLKSFRGANTARPELGKH